MITFRSELDKLIGRYPFVRRGVRAKDGCPVPATPAPAE